MPEPKPKVSGGRVTSHEERQAERIICKGACRIPVGKTRWDMKKRAVRICKLFRRESQGI